MQFKIPCRHTFDTQIWLVNESNPAFVNEENFNEVENDAVVPEKPAGGIWTSTKIDDMTSAWTEWCERENFYLGNHVWEVEIGDARVINIDSIETWENLIEEYGRLCRREQVPDWEAISKDYDGLHMTEDAIYESFTLRSYDVESTVWFNMDVLRSFEYVGEIGAHAPKA